MLTPTIAMLMVAPQADADAAFAYAPAAEAASEAPSAGERLLKLCRAGRLDGTFENACLDAIEEQAGASLGGGAILKDWAILKDGVFWDWLRSHPQLRESACVAATQAGPKVFSNLALLAEHHRDEVERLPALAVAFAAAWTQGGEPGGESGGAAAMEPEPKLFWVDAWLTEGRATPGFRASFADLSARSGDLRFAPQGAPWQVLAHLADSIVPTEERAWAFAKYDARKTPALRGLFGAVEWTLEPKRTGGPYTLQSFLECGGPCTHNVQFAGGIFDAFGIPSGWAGGPGHTYPYWFEMDGKTLRLFRTNELGCRSGKIRNPISEGHIWEDRLRLQVAALNHSRKADARATLAAWAFSQLPEEHRVEASPILAAAVEANPLGYGALLAAARATSKRQLSPGTAGRVWKKAAGAMAEMHPEELAGLIDLALPPLGESAATFDSDIAVIARFEKRHGGRIAPWRFGSWRARALAARGKLPAARRALRGAALGLGAEDATSFQSLLNGLVAITEPGRPRTEALASLLKDMPDPKDGPSQESLRARLLTAAALHRASGGKARGGKPQSRAWVDELVAQQRARTTTGEGAGEGASAGSGVSGEIGGSGGAPFQQSIDGARLVGLRVTRAGFNGRTVIGSIQGIFAAPGNKAEKEAGEGAEKTPREAPTLHAAAGGIRDDAVELTVPEGWTLWGVVASGSDRVDGIQIIATPGPAWTGTAQVSPWIGSSMGNARLLGGPAGSIGGLTGRAGADLDAIGVQLIPR